MLNITDQLKLTIPPLGNEVYFEEKLIVFLGPIPKDNYSDSLYPAVLNENIYS